MKPEERNEKIESYGMAYMQLVSALERYPREAGRHPVPQLADLRRLLVDRVGHDLNRVLLV